MRRATESEARERVKQREGVQGSGIRLESLRFRALADTLDLAGSPCATSPSVTLWLEGWLQDTAWWLALEKGREEVPKHCSKSHTFR